MVEQMSDLLQKAQPVKMGYKNLVAINFRNEDPTKPKSLFLTWVINNICTNACSYCPAEVHNGKNHHYEWKHAQSFIKYCFEKHGNVHCSIAGGEPTVSPFFKQLVHLIYDNGGTVHLTTNLVKSKKYWTDISHKFTNIAASYHPEYITTTEQEDEFIEKCQYLSQYTCVAIRVMMLPELWDRCHNFYKKVVEANNGYSVEMVRILPNFGVGEDYCVIDYTDEQDHILNITAPDSKHRWIEGLRVHTDRAFMKFDTGEETQMEQDDTIYLENNNLANFRNWSCDVGLESLFVHYNGNIHRGNCGVGGVIGNICDFDNIKFPSTSIRCNKDICHCVADLLLSKRIED
jgi:MoaA/NifB/PqqE/SkfB family radical SAM enzyme